MQANELFGGLLGLPVGWRVRSVDISPQQRRVNIHVERAPTSIFAKWLRGGRRIEEHRWQAMPIAGYSCFLHVHADVPEGQRFEPEAWMGEIGRPLTRDCLQTARALSNAIRLGDERAIFDQAFGLALTDVRREGIGIRPPQQSPAPQPQRERATPAQIPTPNTQPTADARPVPDARHGVWRALALGESNLDIKSLPLKLLLTRIRMQVKQDPYMIDTASAELQRFFHDRSRILGHELGQILRTAGRAS